MISPNVRSNGGMKGKLLHHALTELPSQMEAKYCGDNSHYIIGWLSSMHKGKQLRVSAHQIYGVI